MAEAQVWDTIEAVPSDVAALFAEGPFQSQAGWWRAVTRAALPARAKPRFVVCREGGRPLALLPMLALPGQGRLSSLSTPYTVTWQPLVAGWADAAAVSRAATAFGRSSRGWAVLRLEAIDPTWPCLPPFLSGLQRAGYRAARFDHFGTWEERLEGRDWAAYLAGRPGALRETIRRKQARLGREAGWRFDCVDSAAGLEARIADYQHVYRRSWKPPEPFPRFDPLLLREAARAGVLRLGLLSHDCVPVAAQYWTVCGGRAMVLKLAHDQAHRARSSGTLLTAWMIRRLIEQEAVEVLDFGRGDDPYKRLWATARRQRIGVVLADPRRIRGAAALARQWTGDATRWLRRPAGRAGIGLAAQPA